MISKSLQSGVTLCLHSIMGGCEKVPTPICWCQVGRSFVNWKFIFFLCFSWCLWYGLGDLQFGLELLGLDKPILFLFLPQTIQAEGVLLLPASVRPSVRLSVHKLFLIRTITCHRFGLESTNLHPGIHPAGIEDGGHWPWLSRSL